MSSSNPPPDWNLQQKVTGNSFVVALEKSDTVALVLPFGTDVVNQSRSIGNAIRVELASDNKHRLRDAAGRANAIVHNAWRSGTKQGASLALVALTRQSIEHTDDNGKTTRFQKLDLEAIVVGRCTLLVIPPDFSKENPELKIRSDQDRLLGGRNLSLNAKNTFRIPNIDPGTHIVLTSSTLRDEQFKPVVEKALTGRRLPWDRSANENQSLVDAIGGNGQHSAVAFSAVAAEAVEAVEQDPLPIPPNTPEPDSETNDATPSSEESVDWRRTALLVGAVAIALLLVIGSYMGRSSLGTFLQGLLTPEEESTPIVEAPTLSSTPTNTPVLIVTITAADVPTSMLTLTDTIPSTVTSTATQDAVAAAPTTEGGNEISTSEADNLFDEGEDSQGETSSVLVATATPRSETASTNVSEPTLEATPEPTSQPTVVPTPEPTLGPTSQPTRVLTEAPTLTSEPPPTLESEITIIPTADESELAAIENLAVTVISPAEYDEGSSGIFEWQANDSLPPNYAFELIFWNPAEGEEWKNGRGWPDGANEKTKRIVNFNEPDIRADLNVVYSWGVRLVRIEPSYNLTNQKLLSETRRFRYINENTQSDPDCEGEGC